MSRHRPLIFAGVLTGIIVLTVLGVGVRLGAFGLGERQSGAVAADQTLVQAAPLVNSDTRGVGGRSEGTFTDIAVAGPDSGNDSKYEEEYDDDHHRSSHSSSVTRSDGDRRTRERDRDRD